MTNKILLKIFFLPVLLLWFMPVNTVEAAITYSVTPKVIDVAAEARDIITRTITITNNSPVARTSIFPSVNEIALDEGGDLTDFEGPTAVDRTAAVTSWIEVPRRELNINPGESHELTVTIRMNPNTQPGEYHAMIGFGSGRIRADAERLVREGRAPSVVVTIRVEDVSVERMDLEGFFIDKFVTGSDNQAASYTLTNPGDTVVVPDGEIVFYDGNGKEVASVLANPDRLTLKPGEEVEVQTTVPTDGLMGRYKAFLTVNYGASQAAAVYDTAFFYVIPWKKLLVIFGILVVLALILTVYLYKKYGIGEDADDDAHHLEIRFNDTPSDSQDHDINLKKTDSVS